MTLGYPITEKINYHTTIYWSISGALFISGTFAIFSMANRTLTTILVDDNLKISLFNVLFKRRTLACLMVLFISNMVPSVVDSCFKHIMDEVDKADIRLVLYFIPGTAFLIVLLLRNLLILILNSRIMIILGSGMLSGACYMFWPLPRNNDAPIG